MRRSVSRWIGADAMGDNEEAKPLTTVWILGAGFSKPLGGPLLADMLSPESQQDLRIRYPDNPHLKSRAESCVRRIYAYGHKSPSRHHADKAKARLWEHAEEFLDYLDAAAKNANSPAAKRIAVLASMVRATGEPPNDPGVEELQTAARRLVAAECCAFLDGADPETEKWQPYREWSRSLNDGTNAVITFNYDTVLEHLNSGVVVLGDDDYREARKSKQAPIFKMHGSVAWRRTADGAFEHADANDFALTCADSELAIATPGPGKASLCEELRETWERAIQALKTADAIVFLGYRFPPTDASARSMLLEALRENKRPHVDVHIVLGPNVNTADPMRLEHLAKCALEMAGRWELGPEPEPGDADGTFKVRKHPLWAEDFFTVLPALHTGV